MTPKEIINKATELKIKYGTTNAITISRKLGIKVITRNVNPKVFKAHVIQFDNYPAFISINSSFSELSQCVLCAHELGHAILHQDCCINHFDTAADMIKQKMEYEANLFAVALLFDENDFVCRFEDMNNYMLKETLDINIY